MTSQSATTSEPPRWLQPPPRPALGADEAHVWLAHLPASASLLSARPFAQLASETLPLPVLSPDEQARAQRIPCPARRARWQRTRGLLRSLLARYLDCEAGEIVFQPGAHGKPELSPTAHAKLHFNTSHSGDYAALAVTRIGAIGVDVERVNAHRPRLADIVDRYFATGEQSAWHALPEAERVRGFFELWTRKEAFVKARGDGVFSGLDQFEVSLAEPRLLSVRGDAEAAAEWWITGLPPLPGYAGTVAVRTPACAARFWNLE